MKRIRNSKDFFAGALFIAFGLAAMILSTKYRIGTAARMGPGYFPFFLGIVLSALGLLLSARSFSLETPVVKISSIQPRPLFFVLFSVVLFGLFLHSLGLVLTILLLVLFSSIAHHEFRMKETLINSAVLILLVLVIFVYFLEIQVPVWPPLLSGRI
jgi:hypothetical protein